MCLIAFAIDAHAACPLLIAANRDEFFDRPTAGLHRWTLPSGTDVVAGRDLRDGGTWLGVSTGGRVAMLTNVRDGQPGSGRRSRGELPTRWLAGDLDLHGLQAGIAPADYGGFNLVVGDLHQGHWAWLGNRHPARPHEPDASQLYTQRLQPGVYGLSNATLSTPWPKTQRLTRALEASLDHAAQPEAGALWWASLQQALLDDQLAADGDLPRTGVDVDLERQLSSPFVRMPERGYGTRSSLVVRVQPQAQALGRWQVSLDEWTHAQAPTAPGAVHTAGAAPPVHRSETLVW
jgi:uncharacterized protein with NRDE domain